MDSDDDFLPPSQFGRSQTGSGVFRSQSVISKSTNHSQGVRQPVRPIQANPGPSRPHSENSSTNQHGAKGSHIRQTPGTGQTQPQNISPEERLSQLTKGTAFILEQLQQFARETSSIKPPASKLEQKPNNREQCQICKKTYANTTNLFRHYRGIHKEMNPEKYHGFSINDTVVSLDASLRDINCSTSGDTPPTQSLNNNRATHAVVSSNDISNNCETVKYKMYKCEDCSCYFEERSKFDEHMKVQHGFEVVCKICNKNLIFKDIDAHVKDSHPDVYSKKNTEEKKEKYVVEKVIKKQGQRVHAFVCTLCDNIMYDKVSAERHSRSHKKGLKIKATPRFRVSRSVGNLANLNASDNNGRVLFMCDSCNICTGSYDAAVEHSQNHITNILHSVQCVTQTCTICELKFEPLCYKMHIDLHYNNTELHKESFKYYKYKYQLLLSDNWFDCYDMTDPSLKYMISHSVYFHTRSVKMRIMDQGVCSIYKCCQCDKFVEPAAVTNHTLNYDTCLKVKSSYACKICNREYNNRLARDRHTKDHNSKLNFKVVIFNNERDKEFNRVLNDPKLTVDNYFSTALNVHEPSDASNNVKVIYKCLCGLCFVHKETADTHKKICPGKGPRKTCPKCNKIFDSDELVEHCFEHHLNGIQISIENVTPDAIVIDSDEEDTHKDDANDIEVIEINSSDEGTAGNESLDKISTKLCSNEDRANELALNERESVIAQTDDSRPERSASKSIIPTQQDTRDEVEETAEESPEILKDYGDDAMTDDDSQDTINYEHIETPVGSALSSIMDTCNEIKCVPTNLLLDPYLVERGFSKSIDIAVLKKEISTDIEIMRQDIETITETLISEPFDISMTENKSWWYNPTDYSNVRRRPSLRQIEMTPTSSTISKTMTVESLLTDDEEDISPNNEAVNDQGGFTPNISSDSATVAKEMETANDCAESEETSTTQFNMELARIEQVSSLKTNAQQTDQVMDSSDGEINLTIRDANMEKPENRQLDSISRDDVEIGSIGVVIENDVTLYPETSNVQKETDKENICGHVPAEHVQFNNEEDTSNIGETHTDDASSNNITQMDNSLSPELALSPIVDTTNTKKDFVDYMGIKIKSELISLNEQNVIINNCDKDSDVIKIEPKDTSYSEYKRNKENHLAFTYDKNNDNDKNCAIC